MRAWAWGERTIAAWWRFATGGWSSMYVPRPVRRRASSTRFTGLPIQPVVLMGGAAPRTRQGRAGRSSSAEARDRPQHVGLARLARAEKGARGANLIHSSVRTAVRK